MNRMQLIQHMIDEHGWPAERFTRPERDRDGCDTGRRIPLTYAVIVSKHAFDHAAGFKFTAATPHEH